MAQVGLAILTKVEPGDKVSSNNADVIVRGDELWVLTQTDIGPSGRRDIPGDKLDDAWAAAQQAFKPFGK